jgi:hypothetical protein
MPKEKYVVRGRDGVMFVTDQAPVRRGYKAMDVPKLTDKAAAALIAKNFPGHLPVMFCAHDGLINGFHATHKPVTVATLEANITSMRRSVTANDGGDAYSFFWGYVFCAETAKVYLTKKAAGLKSKYDEYIIDSVDPKSEERQKLAGLVHGQEVLLISAG